MMDYEIFRDVVKEKFLSYMPGEYQDMEVKVVPVKKVKLSLATDTPNKRLDGNAPKQDRTDGKKQSR